MIVPYCHLYTTVPGTPNNPIAGVVNSSVLLVSWAEPTTLNGIITSYDVYYSISTSGNCTASGTSQRVPSLSGQTTYNATLTNLIPYSMYAVCVRASTRIGPGNVTASVVITTDPDTSSPPTDFTATAVSSTSIKLTWGYPQTPRGLIAGYQIMHNTTVNPVNIAISTNDTSQQNFTFSGLIPYTAYLFAVRAYSFRIRLNLSTQIDGSYSQQLVVSTLQYGKFGNINGMHLIHIHFPTYLLTFIFHSSFNAIKLPALCCFFQCPYGHMDTSIHTQWDCDRLHSVLYSITEPDLS